MRKIALALTLCLLPLVVLAQTTPPTEPPKITVRAKGEDVRSVLASIFEQAHKQYVLPANFRFALFLSLEDQEYTKALAIVCAQTGLEAVEEDGIVRVRVAPKKVEPSVVEAKEPVAKPMDVKPVVKPISAKPIVETAKPTVVSARTLAKKVTTRMQRAELREVFAALAEQADVTIEVDESVPDYRIDAFLIKTSLKYALDRIALAGNLKYRLTDHGSILIAKK